MSQLHLQDELAKSQASVTIQTQYGPITGGRALNGAAVFLEVPYALPPTRFRDPVRLPIDYRYEDKKYVFESSYATQPSNDGQAAGMPFEDKVGLGKPTENPLFVNIVSPPSFSSESATTYPVKVYIHGGSATFRSYSKAQFISAARSEVWVNIGYRLSAFGFLASDVPRVDGNFGFKDQWLALTWIKENIASFGGNPDDIQISGLSAGAHSVHQLLHHASHLPGGELSPFHSAILQSNAIVIAPKTPTELRPQFQALCHALQLDPSDPDVLDKLRDPSIVPWQAITRAIETDAGGVQYGTFRGCLDGIWLPISPDPMAWQRTGSFARSLTAKGIRSIIFGDLSEEWYLYSIAHPVKRFDDIKLNLERYYQTEVVEKIMGLYRKLPEDATEEEVKRLFGEILSEGQVHLPVRLLIRDLVKAGFPALRYEIRWTPEQNRPLGYVTHATDRSLWALRLPILEPDQADIARGWLDTIANEVKLLEERGPSGRSQEDILVLKEDRTIGWMQDGRWDEMMRLRHVLPGEGSST